MAEFITRIRTEDGRFIDDFMLAAPPSRIIGQADSRSPVTIVILDGDGNEVETFETTANRRGVFRFAPDDLPDGNYTIEVTALQGGEPVTAGTAILVDTYAPVMEAQTYNYHENRVEGDVLATVVASDNTGIVSYTIVGGDEHGWFEVDITGAIKLTEAGLAAAANDFESGLNSFILTIQVTDTSGNTATQDITLNLTNQVDAIEDTLLAEEIRQEVFEDSSSDGPGNGGSRNGVLVTDDDLAMIADNVFRFFDSDGNSVMETRFQDAIEEETGFSNLPTDEEIQNLIDEVNKDLSYLYEGKGLFDEGFVANWDVSNVENMEGLFNRASSFNQDIGGWDVGNVTNMNKLFWVSHRFNQDIGNWNVSRVTSMSSMFEAARDFNQDIGLWDVSNVTDMAMMFSDAESFNQDIGAWDVSSVEWAWYLFNDAKAFDQNLGGWDISSFASVDGMLSGSGMSLANFDSLLAGWSTLDTAAGETAIATRWLGLEASGLEYSDVTSKNHFEQAHDWVIGGSQAATDSEGRTVVAGDNTGNEIDLSGESQAQAIHALGGDDTITATLYDDWIVGGAGNDVMTGGNGGDTYVFRDYGGDAGDFGHDTITDFEAGAGAGDVIRLELTGLTNFDDLLTKATDTSDGVLIQIHDGNSILLEGLTIAGLNEDDFEFVATDSKTFKLGSYGNDTLTGDDHSNRLDGRSGDDTLFGGAGKDTFVFQKGYGNDTISDFSMEDQIEIDAGLAADYQTLESLMSEITDETGTHTVIDFGNGDTLTLENVSANALTADEFSFL